MHNHKYLTYLKASTNNIFQKTKKNKWSEHKWIATTITKCEITKPLKIEQLIAWSGMLNWRTVELILKTSITLLAYEKERISISNTSQIQQVHQNFSIRMMTIISTVTKGIRWKTSMMQPSFLTYLKWSFWV